MESDELCRSFKWKVISTMFASMEIAWAIRRLHFSWHNRLRRLNEPRLDDNDGKLRGDDLPQTMPNAQANFLLLFRQPRQLYIAFLFNIALMIANTMGKRHPDLQLLQQKNSVIYFYYYYLKTSFNSTGNCCIVSETKTHRNRYHSSVSCVIVPFRKCDYQINVHGN